MTGKKLYLAVACFSVCLAAIILVICFSPHKKKTASDYNVVVIDTFIIQPPVAREDITFILGEDHNFKNPYYREATDYYRLNSDSRTEYLITECRSLLEVRNWLINHPPHNKLPWGLINLVSHGSQWLGINIPVIPGSEIVNTDRLNKFVSDSIFKPLPDSLIDHETEIFIHGCGIGNNRALLKAVSKAFGGNENRPVVRASKVFEYYTSTKNNGRPITCQHFLAKVWFLFFKSGQQPEDPVIISDLKKTYPDEKTDWADALKREYPRWPGDLYHYTFTIPLTCILKYTKKDSLPDLSSEEKKLKWVGRQPEIRDFIKMVNIPANRFNWLITKISYLDEKKVRQPAIWVKANCSVFCLLKPLIIDSTLNNNVVMPFVPDSDDSIYYSTE